MAGICVREMRDARLDVVVQAHCRKGARKHHSSTIRRVARRTKSKLHPIPFGLPVRRRLQLLTSARTQVSFPWGCPIIGRPSVSSVIGDSLHYLPMQLSSAAA
jgi:hypothetical protein